MIYRELLDTSPIGLSIVSFATEHRIFVNQRMIELFGAESAEDLLGLNLADSWVDLHQYDECLKIFADGKNLKDYEAERRRLDGSTFWVLMNTQLIDFEGETARAVWHNDISIQKSSEQAMLKVQNDQERMVEERTKDLTNEIRGRQEVEQALGAERHIINMAIETIPQGIIIRDADDNIVLFNNKLPELLGVPVELYENNTSSEEMNVFHQSQTPGVQFSPEGNSKVVEWLEKRRRGEQVEDFSYQRPGIDRKSLLVNFKSMPDGYEIRTFQDITDLKRQEKELLEHRDRLEILVSERTIKLERAKDAAENANRTKSEFLAHMSHELRTPLNAIIGFTQMLMNNVYGPLGHDKYQEYSNDINRSGEHLLHVINDLLDISKVEAGELELQECEFDMVEAIHTCVQMIKNQEIDPPEHINVCVPKRAVQFIGDERVFRQIALNLLSNSAKFTSSDGDISVKFNHSDAGGVVVDFADTGCGIAPADIEKVLTPFGQSRTGVHLSYEGTGLGLTLAKSFTELHGGTLSMASKLGVGTTVTLAFPPERTVSP